MYSLIIYVTPWRERYIYYINLPLQHLEKLCGSSVVTCIKIKKLLILLQSVLTKNRFWIFTTTWTVFLKHFLCFVYLVLFETTFPSFSTFVLHFFTIWKFAGSINNMFLRFNCSWILQLITLRKDFLRIFNLFLFQYFLVHR